MAKILNSIIKLLSAAMAAFQILNLKMLVPCPNDFSQAGNPAPITDVDHSLTGKTAECESAKKGSRPMVNQYGWVLGNTFNSLSF
ncbi:MAG: hypothetical protein WAT19_01085 [Ferruginibacter sp.]